MKATEKPAFGVLVSLCGCHLINDFLQSLLISEYPTIKAEFHLSFARIGLVTLAYQLTASLLQPAVGLYADRKPMPFSLPGGTLFTFVGLALVAAAQSYAVLLAGACILGVGSSVFHPESSRVARMASGGRPGLAQSLFQVGGNIGSALGPVGAATIVLRWGRGSLGAFSLVALVSTAILTGVGLWYRRHGLSRLEARPNSRQENRSSGPALANLKSSGVSVRLSPSRVSASIAVLLMLIFSKFVYVASVMSYYTFYLIERFGISIQSAQMHLFAFLAAAAVGTLAGGPLGDRFGRKRVIWFSILGALPLTLALPYVGLFWTGVLSVAIGVVIASAFPAIVVYGQELIPGRVGMVAGLFFGLSFGAAGLGAALMGKLADVTGIECVYRLCSVLPALGLLAGLLPDLGGGSAGTQGEGSISAIAPAGSSGVSTMGSKSSFRRTRIAGPRRVANARKRPSGLLQKRP